MVDWHGERIKAGDKSELLDKCMNLLRSRNMPIPIDLEWQIEDAICKRMPPDCKDCSPRNKKHIVIDANMVKRFMLTMEDWWKKGFNYVPQEEADRRAAICASCPLQHEAEGCFGCRGIQGLVNVVRGKRSTPYDGRLLNCSVCGCFNQVQVHIPLDVLQKASGDLDYNGNPECWKRV